MRITYLHAVVENLSLEQFNKWMGNLIPLPELCTLWILHVAVDHPEWRVNLTEKLLHFLERKRNQFKAFSVL